MNTAVLITGTNLGKRLNNLALAAEHIQKQIGTITDKSSIYETEAWGIKNEPAFYNQVLVVDTDLTPSELMDELLQIEEKMGRIRTTKNAARIIDIDILFFNDAIIRENNLEIPHKEIANRRFVLVPLAEVCPNLKHPIFGVSILELLEKCVDKLQVQRTTHSTK